MPEEEFKLKVRVNISDDLKRRLSGGIDEAIKKGAGKEKKAGGRKKKEDLTPDEFLGSLVGMIGGGGVQKTLGGMMDVMKSGVLKLGVIVAIVGAVLMAVKKITDLVISSSPALKAVLDVLKTSILMTLKPIGDMVALILAPILTFFYRYFLIPWYQVIYPMITEFLRKIDPRVFQLIALGLGGLALGLAALGLMIVAPLVNLVMILTGMMKFADWLKGSFSKFVEWLKEKLSAWGYSILQMPIRIISAKNEIVRRLREQWDRLGSIKAEIVSGFGKIKSKLINNSAHIVGIKAGIVSGFGEIKSKLIDVSAHNVGIKAGIVSGFGEIKSKLIDVSAHIVGVGQSLVRHLLALILWIANKISPIIEAIKIGISWVMEGISRIISLFGKLLSMLGMEMGAKIEQFGKNLYETSQTMRNVEVNVIIENFVGDIDDLVRKIGDEIEKRIRAEGG